MKKFEFDNRVYGQLTNLDEIKLLILYILIKAQRPLTVTDITEVVRQDELCNYFDMAVCFPELSERHLVDKFNIDGVDYYSPNPKGAAAIGELESMLPRATRDKAQKAVVKVIADILRKEQVKTEIRELPLGCTAVMEINDELFNIFSLSLYVPSPSQAEILLKKFKADPEGVYKKIMKIVTDDEDF